VTFISADDLELFNKWEGKAFELQVANHELLGHGSGKLFTEDAKGNFNFDKERVSRFANSQRVLFSYHTVQVINPLTHGKITSWYKPGQTSSSVLGTVSSSMEECRAEAVALYLVSNKEILSIFNVSPISHAR
jgi:dipeptidyl-peptidase III